MFDDDDIEDEHEFSCPACGHSPLRSRSCNNLSCDDGYIDDSEEDPINYYPGESEHKCEECKGTGVERWCPECGKNLSGYKFSSSGEDN